MHRHRRPTAAGILAAAAIAAAAACAPSAAAAPRTHAPRPHALRTVVFMLDGVPFALVDSLRDAGRFAAFSRPARVVSSFPSITGVAFSEEWDDAPPPGYEDLWFDAASNRVRGGLLDHVSGGAETPAFHRHVDAALAGSAATLGYLAPEILADVELAHIRDAILERADRDTAVVAYVMATDALGHRAGAAGVAHALGRVDALVDELRARFPGLEVILFSDHGNDYLPSRQAPTAATLRRAAFRLTRRLERPRDVVLPRFGLVGGSFLYCRPADERAVASTLARQEGVDVALYQDDAGRVHVLGRRGEALIERRGRAYRYAPASGDPLSLAPALAELRAAGRLDRDGFAGDDAWLDATVEGPFVDAPRRIVHAFDGGVRHPANVIVSYAPGYYHGDPGADLLVDVAGTHGSLRTRSSLAFFMTTGAPPPPLLRAADVAALLPAAARAPASPQDR